MKHYVIAIFILLALGLESCRSPLDFSMGKSDLDALRKELTVMQRNTLIVRLATNQKKGDLLKKHNDVGYNKYVRERKEYVELVQDAWNQNFDFCRLRYMPDSLFQDFIDGVERPFFLNQFGKLDPNITMDTPYFYVVGSGSRDLEFKWYDAELDLLTPQPPVVMNKYTIVELFMNKRKLLHLRIADINQYFKNVLNESKKG